MSRVAIGSDHAGYDLKTHLIDVLTDRGHEVVDHGTDSTEPVDYPDICAAVGRTVRDGGAEFGIVLDRETQLGFGRVEPTHEELGSVGLTLVEESEARAVRRPDRAHVVRRVGHHPEIAKQVFHLGAIVEAHATDDAVSDVRAAECLFDHARLRVRSVEHRDV